MCICYLIIKESNIDKFRWRRGATKRNLEHTDVLPLQVVILSFPGLDKIFLVKHAS
jgi:hypothetical protein